MSDRFARHTLIPGWRQDMLASATTIIIGVGALGNEVARLLAMAGVGHLIICDPDVVAESNLSRTVLFRAADIGRSKVTAATEALLELAPRIRVDAIDRPHVNGVGLGLLRDASLVISCLDSMAARVQLAARCNAVGAGLLDAGTHPWGGQVCYYPPGGACLGCALSDEERGLRDDPWSCTAPDGMPDAGASAPVSALIGSWEASFAVRVLLGLPVSHAALEIESGGATSSADMTRNPDCPLHDSLDPGKVDQIGERGTVADILAFLKPDEEAFTWASIPGLRTVLLRQAPAGAPIAAMGVARQEILPVARRGQLVVSRYLELGKPGL